MNAVFSNNADYYDLIYKEKDYLRETLYFCGLLKKHESHPTKSILEFGAGSGGHQLELLKQGFEAVGVDQSVEMCAAATRRGAQVFPGDFRTYKHHSPVDAVLALFHVVSYLTSDADLHRAFLNARENLQTGGLFLFDIWFKDAVLYLGPEMRVKRFTGETIEVVRIVEPTLHAPEEVVIVNYSDFVRKFSSSTWGRIDEYQKIKCPWVSEILGLASATGFAVHRLEETLT